MGTIKQLQHKSSISLTPAVPTPSLLRPSRPFSPLPISASQFSPDALPAEAHANMDYPPRLGYSIANIPIFSAVQRKAALTSPLQEENQFRSRIQAARSNGHPLDKQTQQRLEQGLGTDLSGIRVHTDREADHLARAINAVAFTTGADIFFRAGTYNPRTREGLHMVAHEATHVVQQATGPVAGVQRGDNISISDPSDRFERAAKVRAAGLMTDALLKHTDAGGRDTSGSFGARNSLIPLRIPSAGSSVQLSIQRLDIPGYYYQGLPLNTTHSDKILLYVQEQLQTPKGQERVNELLALLTNYVVVGRYLKEVSFEGESGEEEGGYYYQKAQKNSATNLQSKDAEVVILDRLQKYLDQHRQQFKKTYDEPPMLIIWISKGPCDSCRALIKEFQKYNGIPVIIRYTQSTAQTGEQVGKEQSQKALTYGYGDAQVAAQGSFYKLFGIGEPDLPPNPKGWKKQALDTLLKNFKDAHRGDMTKIDTYIDTLKPGVLAQGIDPDEQRKSLKQWLRAILQYETSHTLGSEEVYRLSRVDAPAGGTKVRAQAKLFLSRKLRDNELERIKWLLGQIEEKRKTPSKGGSKEITRA